MSDLKRKIFTLSLGAVAVFAFLGATTLYFHSIHKSPKAIENELAFINRNHCVLNNWEVEKQVNKKPVVRLKSLVSSKISKWENNDVGYVKLKHHQQFIYECKDRVQFKSYFGFISKVTNTKTTINSIGL